MRGSRLQFSRSSHDRYGASGSRAAHKSRWRASGARRGVSCDRWFARQCRQWGLGIRATWRSVQPQAHLCLSSGRAEWWAQSCRVRLPIFLAHTWMMCMGCRIVANICFLVMCVKCLMRSLFGSSAAWSPSGVRGYNPGSERCCVGALPSCCLRPGPASHSPCPCGAQGLCSRPALGRWRFVWARSTCARQSPGKWRDATYGLTCNWATALSAYTSPACFVKRLSHRVGCHALFPKYGVPAFGAHKQRNATHLAAYDIFAWSHLVGHVAIAVATCHALLLRPLANGSRYALVLSGTGARSRLRAYGLHSAFESLVAAARKRLDGSDRRAVFRVLLHDRLVEAAWFVMRCFVHWGSAPGIGDRGWHQPFARCEMWP